MLKKWAKAARHWCLFTTGAALGVLGLRSFRGSPIASAPSMDLRGWGKSARHTDDYSLFTQADDVEGVIKALNVKDFVLVGHSMGGKIAQ